MTFELTALIAAQRSGKPLNGETIAELMAPIVREMQLSQIALFEKIVKLGKPQAT